MFQLNIRGEEISVEEYAEREKYFSEQQKLFRFYAIKTKLSQKLWQKRCIKHRVKDSSFQGYWQTDWEKIRTLKRR